MNRSSVWGRSSRASGVSLSRGTAEPDATVPRVSAYLRRLVRTGAAYQANDVVTKVLALALLPLYTRYLTPRDYGTVDLLMTLVILVSLVVRLGLVEAFVRFYFSDEDVERRDRLARTTTGAVVVATTVVAVPCLVLSGPLSKAVLSEALK